MDKKSLNNKLSKVNVSIVKLQIIEQWQSCKNYFNKKFLLFIPIILLILLFLTSSFHFNLRNLGLLATFIGLLFAALKYYLDRANYQKSLFNERYAILVKLD